MISTDAMATLAAAGGADVRSLPRSGGKADDAESFQQFEALLLGEVLKAEQRSSLAADHALSGGSAGKMYREMFMDELATQLSKAGGIGIARDLGTIAARRSAAAPDEENPRG